MVPGVRKLFYSQSFENALVELNKKPDEVVIVSGIGQAAKAPHYLRCNNFNGLHGRTLPVATGIKLANHELTVLAEGGDGDGYGEGGNHFIHGMRRNIDITYLVHNNQVYGLTKGQTSPTSELGYVSHTTPSGAPNPPMNPLLIAIASDCGFVARGFAGDPGHLSHLIQEGIRFKGFAFIDILQPCVSFNHVNTFPWYASRVYKINEEPGYDPENRMMAFKGAQEWGERIPIGVLYQSKRSTLDEKHASTGKTPLVKQKVDREAMEKMLGLFR